MQIAVTSSGPRCSSIPTAKTINDSWGTPPATGCSRGGQPSQNGWYARVDWSGPSRGDEFVLFAASALISPRRRCSRLTAERLIGETPPLAISEARCCIGASVGITLFPGPGAGGGGSAQQADTAMYQGEIGGPTARPDASSMPPCGCRPTGASALCSELRSAPDNGS